MSNRLFVFGLGFSGLEIARAAMVAGWPVSGCVTTAEKAVLLQRGGVDAVTFDMAGEKAAAATHILVSIPPGEAGDPALPACAELRPAWLGYLSTTGVYGDSGGGWVDETDTPHPTQARSRNRLAAEQAWQAWGAAQDVPLNIFRLPAIYGTGRSALDQVREGRAQRIDKPGQVFSRVHVADLAQTVLASLARGGAGAVYNVTDDDPAPQADVIAFACELLGVPALPLVPYDEAAKRMSAMAQSFYSENRRVRNDRIKRELGIVLAYPSYREGLRAIRESE